MKKRKKIRIEDVGIEFILDELDMKRMMRQERRDTFLPSQRSAEDHGDDEKR